MLLPAWPLKGVLLAALLAISISGTPAQGAAGVAEVDAEIVLAVDISYSMDAAEQKLQRAGYIEALTSPEFVNALSSGPNGAIALTYVEWSDAADQQVLVDWRLVNGAAAAQNFADELAAAPYRRALRTSIAGAIDFSAKLFEGNGYKSPRRIIDISGDGPNNDGRLVTRARDDAVGHGITINGLPLLIRPPTLAYADIENLDIYYTDCVIGGAGAFVVAVRDKAAFVSATRTKLVLEMSGATPLPQVQPAQAKTPRISCAIGEALFYKRWGN
jgi:Protein of unknown function (DUF1194)